MELKTRSLPLLMCRGLEFPLYQEWLAAMWASLLQVRVTRVPSIMSPGGLHDTEGNCGASGENKDKKVRVRTTAGKVQNGSPEMTRLRAHTRQANCKPHVLGARKKPHPPAGGGPCSGLWPGGFSVRSSARRRRGGQTGCSLSGSWAPPLCLTAAWPLCSPAPANLETTKCGRKKRQIWETARNPAAVC